MNLNAGDVRHTIRFTNATLPIPCPTPRQNKNIISKPSNSASSSQASHRHTHHHRSASKPFAQLHLRLPCPRIFPPYSTFSAAHLWCELVARRYTHRKVSGYLRCTRLAPGYKAQVLVASASVRPERLSGGTNRAAAVAVSTSCWLPMSVRTASPHPSMVMDRSLTNRYCQAALLGDFVVPYRLRKLHPSRSLAFAWSGCRHQR